MPNNPTPVHVAVGQARRPDARSGAREAAKLARQQLGEQTPGWAVVFAGGQLDPNAVLEGIRAELGQVPVFGGAGTGIIVTDSASNTGYECGLLVFSSALMPHAVIREPLGDDETAAGQRLGSRLAELHLGADQVVLLFYDSIKSSPPPVLHLGSPLLDGVHHGLRNHTPMIVGAGTIGDMYLASSFLFDGEGASEHAAVAVALPEQLTGHTTISHGCLPASDFLEITAIDGARVLELDHQPALQVVEQRLGVPRQELLARKPLPALTLGEKHGDPFASFNDSQYVNRLVIAIDPEAQALILFESDFRVGSKVQLMSYEPRRMLDSAREQTAALLADLGDQPPACAFYFDCAGRSMAFSGMDEDESMPVRELVATRCPFLGVYSGVEIAPFMGRSRPLDWTGVLLILTQNQHQTPWPAG